MRAGIPADGTILAGAALATVALFLVQAVILIGYGVRAGFAGAGESSRDRARAGSGPLGTLPGEIEEVASYLPLAPFTEVIRDGWLGGEVFAMLPDLGVLAAWVVVASLLARAVFRWEPRAT